MTDRKTLFTYRIKQAEETLFDAENMLQNNLSARSITNRSYYSMFYAVLALFLNKEVHLKTSKHSGVLSIFDKEFVHTKKIDKYYSKILHRMFNMRQEGDYKELVEISPDDAMRSVEDARNFLNGIKGLIKSSS
jgi:uncharacterized protein (UPF0332 family)